MSYRDPYADPHYGGGNPYLSLDTANYGQNQYSEAPLNYNPYTGPSHPTYDQSGYGPGAHEEPNYTDEPAYPPQRKPTQRTVDYNDESIYPPQRKPTQRTVDYNDESSYPPQRRPTQRTFNYADEPDYPPQRRPTHRTQYSEPKDLHQRNDSYQPNEFSSTPRPKKTTAAMRQYRSDHQGALWTKGGRGRCIGRFCCCTLMTVVVLIVSIGLALVLWVRPPGVIIGDIAPVSKAGTSTIETKPDGNGVALTIHLALNITVDNPNYFSVGLKKIKADLIYPTGNTPIGGGEANNIVFPTQTQTDWTFFIDIQYSTSADPNGLVLTDLVSKCGANKKNLDVNYKITLGLQILFVQISPTISNSLSFPCPLDEDTIKQITGGAGLAGIPGL